MSCIICGLSISWEALFKAYNTPQALKLLTFKPANNKEKKNPKQNHNCASFLEALLHWI